MMTHPKLEAPAAALQYMNPLPKTDPSEVLSVQYYASLWRQFEVSSWFLSWNWPAFFLGFFWFFYRRLYGWGAVALVLSAALFYYFFAPLAQTIIADHPFLAPDFHLNFAAALGWWFLADCALGAVFALVGNALYLQHVRAAVDKKSKPTGAINIVVPVVLVVGIEILSNIAGCVIDQADTVDEPQRVTGALIQK